MAVAEGWFRWLSHVCPSEGCLTVRAVWNARLVLNPAGTGVTGVMDPGLGSVRSVWEAKVPLPSFLGWSRCVGRTVCNGAVRSKLIFPITLLSWHAWTMMRSSRSADVGHPSIHRRIVRIM